MAQCELCQTTSAFISEALGVCVTCIRERPREALEITGRAHRESRAEFGLPPIPPDDPEGVRSLLLAWNELSDSEKIALMLRNLIVGIERPEPSGL